MIAIDRLCYTSRLRKKNAEVKLCFSMVTLLICVVSRDPLAAAAALLTNGYLTVRRGGVPLKKYVKFLLVPLAFLILSTLAILFHITEEPLDLFAVKVGKHYLSGSRAGLFYALQLILTAEASVSCLYFLSMTTPMPDILNVLDRLHCPRLLSELMLLIYRYIFVLLDTASNITVSQQCRLGNRDYRTALKSFGALGSVLMLRAIGRARALYDAMEARCYDGRIRVLSDTSPGEKKDIVGVFLFETLLLILCFWRLFL